MVLVCPFATRCCIAIKDPDPSLKAVDFCARGKMKNENTKSNNNSNVRNYKVTNMDRLVS